MDEWLTLIAPVCLQVLPELQTPLAQREVLKADCLRFLLVFRQQVLIHSVHAVLLQLVMALT